MPVYAIDIKENAGVNLTDYQVKIVLENIGFTDWANLTADSIYFTDANGNPLYFWIERLDTTNKRSTIWVKIPSIPANSIVRIYMYYGGSNPYSSYNDPYKTFLFFEDFENDRDPNWVDGSLTPGQYEYATPQLWTGRYRLHFKTGRSTGAFYNMWWKGRTFDNFRFIAYLRADYSDDDSAVLIRSTGKEVGSAYASEGYRIQLPRSGYQYFYIVIQKADGSYSILANLSASPTSDIVRYEILAYGSRIRVIIERPPYNYLGTIDVTDATYSSGYIGLAAPGWDSNRNPSFDTFAVANYIDPEPTVVTGIPIVLSDVVEYSQIAPIVLSDVVEYSQIAPIPLSDVVANIPPSAPSILSDVTVNIPPSAPIVLSDTALNLLPTAPIVLSDSIVNIPPVAKPIVLSDVTINIPPTPYIPPPTPTCLEFQNILSQPGYSWEKAIASLLCGLEAVLTELGNEISRSAKIISLVFIGIGFGYALMRIGEKIIMLVLKGLRKSYEKKR